MFGRLLREYEDLQKWNPGGYFAALHRGLKEQVLVLTEAMDQAMEGSGYVMLDDFQEIQQESVFLLIRLLMDNSPAKIHFCFAVRGKFPHFLASYILNGDVKVFEAPHLRFTGKETKKVIKQLKIDRGLSQMADKIQEYTKGWPAGVKFVCLARKEDDSFQDKIFDYIEHEIFGKLPPEVQCFLVETSCLDSLDPKLCNYVMGNFSSYYILGRLAAEELFVYKCDGFGRQYRCCPIFRDFLRERQEEGKKREILTKAAWYMAENGQPEQAAAYAMECEAYEVMWTVVEKWTESMLKQGKNLTLERWISYLYPVKDKVSSLCAYEVSRFFSERDEKEKSCKCLARAVEKSKEEGRWERCGQYGLELTECLETVYGMGRAVKAAQKLEIFIRGKEPGLCNQFHLKVLEYRLQMNDRNWMRQFFNRNDNKRRNMQFLTERNAVSWAIRLRGKKDGWGNTLEESRMYRKVSPVFAHYGFFSYGWFLYLHRQEACRQVLEEGLSIEGDSIYRQWMRLLMILIQYRKDGKITEAMEEEVQQIGRRTELNGLEYPALIQEDEELLTGMLLGRAGGISQETPPPWEPENEKQTTLEVLCLGGFLVMAGDEVLRWRTRKTKELFACLLCQEGRGIDKKGLIFRLWPEAEEKRGSVLFNTTISYLRKTLAKAGAPGLLMVKDHLYFLDMSLIRSDMGRMEEIAAMVRDRQYQAMDYAGELMELYGGDYFGSEDYRWLIGKKEYAEQMFLQTAKQMAVWGMKRGQYGQAAMILQKIMEISGGSSDTLRRLMACRLRQGDAEAARRQYDRLRRVWEMEWEQKLPEKLADFMDEEDEGEYEGVI